MVRQAVGPSWAKLAQVVQPPGNRFPSREVGQSGNSFLMIFARHSYWHSAQQTWAKHCDGFVLWDENRDAISALDMSVETMEPMNFRPRPMGLSYRWLRTRRLWRYILGAEVEKYEWFLVFDDGGFPIIENLRHLLQHFSADDAIMMSDHDRPAAFGSLLSRGAAKVLSATLNQSHERCPRPTQKQSFKQLQAYASLWNCLSGSAFGVRRVSWDQGDLQRLLGADFF
eukprot:symbB.v1.2.011019.t1/scaffold726.1/size168711/5